ncbi:MFS transporter [Xinfangfangia sp. D13-10-4-6]|uniref:MFS transporter n=1 Tax=Pseudogemmobacter hezensis TaxID=2737662 RepID=UPI001553B1C2|nr:MFS transporter [Pseudogemmobacter hezensis]NPD16661.1 MFS transporter [Pseudogemmobacter hezensis]
MRPQSTPDVKLHNESIASFGTRHIVLLLLLMACGFLVVGQLYVTIPLVADVAGRFSIAPERAAWIGSAFGFAYATGFLVFGPLSDRFGRRRLILFGLTATALATVVVSLAQSFEMLLAARAMQGFVAAAFPPAALSLIAEELPPDQRPFGVSLMSFAFLGAAPLAQVFAAGTDLGLSEIMLPLAPIYLLAALALFFVTQANNTQAVRAGSSQGKLGSLLQDAGILAAWAAAVTVLFGFVSLHAGAQSLGADLGVDLQTLRLVGLPPLLLTFAAAPLTRRRGAAFTARLGLVFAGLALVLAAIGTAWAVMGASVVLSAGVAFAVPGLIATVAGRATNANRGLALALYTFSLFVGASLAPPIAQSLAQSGPAPLWLLPAGLLLMAALGITVTRKSSSPSP